jgi:RimJ/RimL family protein N-acetyltransferase
MAAIVAGALAAWHRGERVPWVQRSAQTGEVVGTTSYANLDEVGQRLEIGHTLLGKPWWHTEVNTEAKLLLLTRAFEELGAIRVEWLTDMRDERVRHDLEQFGAVWEGVRRSYRRRADVTPRNIVTYGMTTEDWAEAKARLTG